MFANLFSPKKDDKPPLPPAAAKPPLGSPKPPKTIKGRPVPVPIPKMQLSLTTKQESSSHSNSRSVFRKMPTPTIKSRQCIGMPNTSTNSPEQKYLLDLSIKNNSSVGLHIASASGVMGRTMECRTPFSNNRIKLQKNQNYLPSKQISQTKPKQKESLSLQRREEPKESSVFDKNSAQDRASAKETGSNFGLYKQTSVASKSRSGLCQLDSPSNVIEPTDSRKYTFSPKISQPVEPKSTKGCREDEYLDGRAMPGGKTIITTPGVTIVSEESQQTEFDIQRTMRVPSEDLGLEPESMNKRKPSATMLPFTYNSHAQQYSQSLRQSQSMDKQIVRHLKKGPASGTASKGEPGPMQSFVLSSQLKSSVTKTKNSFDGDDAIGLSENNSSSEGPLDSSFRKRDELRRGRSPSPELLHTFQLQRVEDQPMKVRQYNFKVKKNSEIGAHTEESKRIVVGNPPHITFQYEKTQIKKQKAQKHHSKSKLEPLGSISLGPSYSGPVPKVSPTNVGAGPRASPSTAGGQDNNGFSVMSQSKNTPKNASQQNAIISSDQGVVQQPSAGMTLHVNSLQIEEVKMPTSKDQDQPSAGPPLSRSFTGGAIPARSVAFTPDGSRDSKYRYHSELKYMGSLKANKRLLKDQVMGSVGSAMSVEQNNEGLVENVLQLPKTQTQLSQFVYFPESPSVSEIGHRNLEQKKDTSSKMERETPENRSTFKVDLIDMSPEPVKEDYSRNATQGGENAGSTVKKMRSGDSKLKLNDHLKSIKESSPLLDISPPKKTAAMLGSSSKKGWSSPLQLSGGLKKKSHSKRNTKKFNLKDIQDVELAKNRVNQKLLEIQNSHKRQRKTIAPSTAGPLVKEAIHKQQKEESQPSKKIQNESPTTTKWANLEEEYQDSSSGSSSRSSPGNKLILQLQTPESHSLKRGAASHQQSPLSKIQAPTPDEFAIHHNKIIIENTEEDEEPQQLAPASKTALLSVKARPNSSSLQRHSFSVSGSFKRKTLLHQQDRRLSSMNIAEMSRQHKARQVFEAKIAVTEAHQEQEELSKATSPEGSSKKNKRESVSLYNNSSKNLKISLSNIFQGALNYTQVAEFKLGKMLGQGAYGMVREAVHVETGFRVAIKIYDKFKLNQNSQIKKTVQREIKILRQISRKQFDNLSANSSHGSNPEVQKKTLQQYGHPAIMKLYDAIDTQRQLFLVVEFCHGKMLNTVVRENTDMAGGASRKNLPEEACAKIFYQIMKGMEFYHSLNVAHRDIKLDNILVDMEQEDMTTKIIDFGFATQVSNESERLKTFCGTPAYMAPELCNKKEYLGSKVDMWAAGIVLYTLLIGTQPFKAKAENELFKKISKGVLSFPKSSHPDFTKSGGDVSKCQSSMSINDKNKVRSTMKLNPSDILVNNLLRKKQSTRKSIQRTSSAKFDASAVEEDAMSGTLCFSKMARNLISDVLQVDDKIRPDAAVVLEKYKPWFKAHGLKDFED